MKKIIFILSSIIVLSCFYQLDISAQETLTYITTCKKEQTKNTKLNIDLMVPCIQNTHFKDLEKDINYDILHKVNSKFEEVKHESEQYYQDFLESKIQDSKWIPLELIVTYDIKKEDSQYLSFELTLFKSYLSAQTEKYFYNLDLNNGKFLTLQDLLGPQYKEIVNPQIKEQIKKRESDENQLFFHDQDEFTSISDHQKFYINDANQIVIVFDKYSIAPGYMGFPEFVLNETATLSH